MSARRRFTAGDFAGHGRVIYIEPDAEPGGRIDVSRRRMHCAVGESVVNESIEKKCRWITGMIHDDDSQDGPGGAVGLNRRTKYLQPSMTRCREVSQRRIDRLCRTVVWPSLSARDRTLWL